MAWCDSRCIWSVFWIPGTLHTVYFESDGNLGGCLGDFVSVLFIFPALDQALYDTLWQ